MATTPKPPFGTEEYHRWALADEHRRYTNPFPDPDTANIELEKRIAAELTSPTGKLDLRLLNFNKVPENFDQLPPLEVLLVAGYWDGAGAAENFPVEKLLKHQSSLRYLSLGLCNLPDMAFVGSFPNLVYLSLHGNQIQTLQGLDNATQLQTLDLASNKIQTIQGLDNATQLQTLDLADNKIQTIQGLDNATQLQTLRLDYNQIQTINGLDKTTQLQTLDLDNNPVQTIQGIKHLTKLHKLDISHIKLNTLDLTELPQEKLQELICKDTTIGNIPSAILSKDFGDNCLDRVQEHFASLSADDSKQPQTKPDISPVEKDDKPAQVAQQEAPASNEVKEIKEIALMVLGNGQIGKTQLCRRLCGKDYNPNEPSTHGVLIKRTPLPMGGDDTVMLNIWDFGGQEIYHGTHSLFFNARQTVFLLLWLPEAENSDYHTVDGVPFKNHTLGYWLEHIHQYGGKEDATVIVVQAQCDNDNDYCLDLPLEPEWYQGFNFARKVVASGKSEHGLDELLPLITKGVRHTLPNIQQQRMPQSWLRVKNQIHRWLEDNNDKPAEEKQHQLLTQAEFRALCLDGTPKVPESAMDTLLQLLHHTGVVFYQQGLFNNRILLDQSWCLAAIYAVFHRDKTLKCIRENRGLFRAEELGLWLWNDQGHSPADQQLFIEMMENCGVCFPLTGSGERTRYLVPELLPEADDQYIKDAIQSHWQLQQGEPIARDFTVNLLHNTLFNRIMAAIGRRANEGAVYWKNGVLAYATEHKGWLLFERTVEQEWHGKLSLKARGPNARALLNHVVAWIEQEQQGWNVKLVEQADKYQKTADLQPQTPAPAFQQHFRQVCISYRWQDDSVKVVEQFCEQAKTQAVEVLRDTDDLNMGDRLSSFMAKIGAGQRVIVILSNEYLQSPNCMFELYEIWRNCQSNGDEFIKRVKAFRMEGLTISTLPDRIKHSVYWKEKYQEIDALVSEHGNDVIGKEDFAEFKRIQAFYLHIGDMLKHIDDTLSPRQFDELLPYGLDGL